MKLLAIFTGLAVAAATQIPDEWKIASLEYAAAWNEGLFDSLLSSYSSSWSTEVVDHIQQCYDDDLINRRSHSDGRCNNLLVPGSGMSNRSFAAPLVELDPLILAQLPSARQTMRHALAPDHRTVGATTTTTASKLTTKRSATSNLLHSGFLQIITHQITETHNMQVPFSEVFDWRTIENDPDRCMHIDADDPSRYMRPPKQHVGGVPTTAYPSTVLSDVETPECRSLIREERDSTTGRSINFNSAFSNMYPFYDDVHRDNGACELLLVDSSAGELYNKRGHQELAANGAVDPHFNLTLEDRFLSWLETGRIIDPFANAPFAFKAVLSTPDSRSDSNAAMIAMIILYYKIHNEKCADYRSAYPTKTEDELYSMAYDFTTRVHQYHLKEAIEHVVEKNLHYTGYNAGESSDVPIDLDFSLRSHTIPPNFIPIFDADTLEVVELEDVDVLTPAGEKVGETSYPVLLLQSGQGSATNGGGLAIIQEAGGYKNLLASALINPMSEFDLQVSGPLDFSFRSVPNLQGPTPNNGKYTTDLSIPTTSLLKSRENGVPTVGEMYPSLVTKHASCNDTTSLACFYDFLDRETTSSRVISMQTLYLDVNNIDLMLAAWANTDVLKAEWERTYDFISGADRHWVEKPSPGWSLFDIYKLKRDFNLADTIDRYFGDLCDDVCHEDGPFAPRTDVYDAVNLDQVNLDLYNGMRAAHLAVGNNAPVFPGTFDVKHDPLLPGQRVIVRG